MPDWEAEVEVDAALAQRLLAEQFPALASLPIGLLGSGWDNTVYSVGEDWVFRFPRREIVRPGFRNEIDLLPELAELVPVAIPVPEHVGAPPDTFPWPFFGARMLPGVEVCEAPETPRDRVASDLGRFLRTLHGAVVMAALGERLPENWTRRADMALRVPMIVDKLDALESLWRAPDHVRAFLEEARALPPPEAKAVCHGDLHFRHVIVGDGHVTGVIDWIDLCRGDPALDLALVWSVLPPGSRGAFLAEYGGVEDDTLLRARAIAVFLGAALLEFAHYEGLGSIEREALASLERAASP